MKDYECDITYHTGKANVVVDALTKKIVLPQITTHGELQQKCVREQIQVIIG